MQSSQNENIQNLNSHFPGMFKQPTELTGRVGFRAVSQDRIPIVGLVPDKSWFNEHYSDLHHGKVRKKYELGQYFNGLFVNAAHGSRGLTTSFISAEILLSQIEGSPIPVTTSILNALSPARFLIRNLKRNQR